jgi:hypothetical protein
LWGVLLCLAGASLPLQGRELDLAQRVACQTAIERVYHSHRAGTRRPLHEVMPAARIRSKVVTHLKQSVALERFWGQSLTAEALQGELERITKHTRLPDRLHQVFAALGNDPFVIQECLVRPILVDRQIRRLQALDTELHREVRRAAEAVREALAMGKLDKEAPHDARTVEVIRLSESKSDKQAGPEAIRLEPDEYTWRRARAPAQAGEIGPVVEGRNTFRFRAVLHETHVQTTIATYSFAKFSWNEWWSQVEPTLTADSARSVAAPLGALPSIESALTGPCVPDDTWENGSLDDWADQGGASTVWTGSEMITCGWVSRGRAGLRYDPLLDTWLPTSTTNAPSPRNYHTAAVRDENESKLT